MQSFPTRERGLKSLAQPNQAAQALSFPTRERGLKYRGCFQGVHEVRSFPTRERGLKLLRFHILVKKRIVVPHAGTWIEIEIDGLCESTCAVVPHAGTWIEISSFSLFSPISTVVPHAGTWIEISSNHIPPFSSLSFPTRERGLKYMSVFPRRIRQSRSPRGNVD